MIEKMAQKLKQFRSCNKGNVAIAFAISAVGLAGVSGGAIDYVSMSGASSSLQAITDAAVLASAKELQLSGSDNSKSSRVKEVANSYVLQAMKNQSLKLSGLSADVSSVKGTVALKVAANIKLKFLPLLGFNQIKTITADAVAKLYTGMPLCVLALDETRGQIIAAHNGSQITATNCTVHANSNSVKAVEAWGSALISVGLTCSAGGVAGGSQNFIPAPVTDCPKMPDPLASRIPPAVVGCDFKNMLVSKGEMTLSPGVYCGGIQVKGSAVVKFLPGDYIIKDGIFESDSQAKIIGEDVAFFLTGKNSIISFKGKSDIFLKGRESGVMAGLLFFSDPAFKRKSPQEIVTDYARVLEGTIYFPNDDFNISSKSANPGVGGGIAAESAYTVIISKSLTLKSGPKLVLNTDYSISPVPVPENISRISGNISLVR